MVSVGGTPPGTVATTPDEAWRAAFESVFLGAVRLARLLGLHLSGKKTRRPETVHRGAAARSSLSSPRRCVCRSPNSCVERPVPGPPGVVRCSLRNGPIRSPDQRDVAGPDRDRQSASARCLSGDPDGCVPASLRTFHCAGTGARGVRRVAAFLLSPAASYIPAR